MIQMESLSRLQHHTGHYSHLWTLLTALPFPHMTRQSLAYPQTMWTDFLIFICEAKKINNKVMAFCEIDSVVITKVDQYAMSVLHVEIF